MKPSLQWQLQFWLFLQKLTIWFFFSFNNFSVQMRIDTVFRIQCMCTWLKINHMILWYDHVVVAKFVALKWRLNCLLVEELCWIVQSLKQYVRKVLIEENRIYAQYKYMADLVLFPAFNILWFLWDFYHVIMRKNAYKNNVLIFQFHFISVRWRYMFLW